ncbi:hypothetical protein Hanom_Chr10g00938651 [Helianthus anomalus]
MPPMYNGEFSTATFVFEILTSIANIRSALLSLKAKGMFIHGSIVYPLFDTPFISIRRIFKF